MNRFLLIPIVGFFLIVQGCATPDRRIFADLTQVQADEFILTKANSSKSANITLMDNYTDKQVMRLTTSGSNWTCNKIQDMTTVTKLTITSLDANKVSALYHQEKDCESAIQTKQHGRYNNKYLYLTGNSGSSPVKVYEILQNGQVLDYIGKYQYVDGVLQFLPTYPMGRVDSGTILFNTKFQGYQDSQKSYVQQQESEAARQDAIRGQKYMESERENAQANRAALIGFQQNLNKMGADLAEQDRQTQLIYTKMNQEKQDRINRAATEARESQRAAADQRAQDNERIRQQNQSPLQQGQGRQQNLALQQEQVSKNAEVEATKLAEQKAKKQGQERQQNLARQQEQAREDEQARKQEQERKKAEAAAAKLAEQQAEKQAKEQYLKSVAAGSRLVATKCPDGKGIYYATGTRAKIKPEVVSCLDLHYRAYCPGSTQYSEGTAKNFIGMSGCFGDTYDINPKPDCKVEQVRIEIVEARACGG